MSFMGEAVVVAAGLGTRLQSLADGGAGLVKPLCPVGGVPLLRRVLDLAFAGGLSRVVLVTGFMAEELERGVRSWALGGDVEFVFNPDFRLSNGVSLYRGAAACRGDFVLLMSDHLFQRRNLQGLLGRGLSGDEGVLAVDQKVSSVFDLEDATKVQTRDGRIVGIGKSLAPYDCVDTGMFLFSRGVADSLAELISRNGDASISAAVNALVRRGSMAAFDIGEGVWQDVDTPEMYAQAETLLRLGVFENLRQPGG
jgi:choline kinase